MTQDDSEDDSDRIERQIEKAGLPKGGSVPFVPKLDANRKGEKIIRKEAIVQGPRKGKRGYVDSKGRIWIRDRAHGDYPDHWDVQEDGGEEYFRVGDDGEMLP